MKGGNSPSSWPKPTKYIIKCAKIIMHELKNIIYLLI